MNLSVRALCNQLYLDEVAAKEAAREQKLRDIYAELSLPRNPRTLTDQQMDNFVSRMAEQDVRRRDGKIRELKVSPYPPLTGCDPPTHMGCCTVAAMLYCLMRAKTWVRSSSRTWCALVVQLWTIDLG